jgi:UrcA family protein
MNSFPQTIFAVGLVLSATQVSAQENPVVIEGGIPTAVVSYADLNLTSNAGRQVLERRVEGAAAGLCYEYGRVAIERTVAGRACYDTAMFKARTDIGSAIARANNAVASEHTITLAAR